MWPPTPTQAAALATVLLALFTFLLFIVTWRVARTTQREVQAQWRPALVPGRTTASDRTRLGMTAEASAIYMESPGRLSVALYNAGTGPALDIEATLSSR
jgi:hypothetical protein